MDSLIALFITLGVGLSFWIGALITKVFNNKDNLNHLAISMALVVMLGLVFFDFIPHLNHVYENVTVDKRVTNIVFYVLLGIIILKLLDFFVPDHHHTDIEKHSGHLFHIGVVTSISLIIHNLIEGLSIYNLSLVDVRSGLLMALGVVMHNIPLGISIFATLGLDKMNKSKKIMIMLVLNISTFLGAFIIYLLGGTIGEYLQGTLICVTLGMLIYITVFELFNEFLHHIKSKYTLIGSVLGLVVVLLTIIM